jgi:hypothetical protein
MRTKSGQDLGCIEARFLVSSVEGDVLASFTTHPDSPQRGHVELSLFDPTVSRMTLFDVDFTQRTPRVVENPEECQSCHGGRDGTLNWRMDPYRFWSFMTPFIEDGLRRGSVETDWYLSFLDRISSGEPGLQQLKPYNKAKTIQEGLDANGFFQLKADDAAADFSGKDTPGLNLSHSLLEKNACRTAVSLAQRPDFDRIKYAALGGMFDCPNIETFFPTQGSYTKDVADRYFVQMQLGVDASGAFSLDALTADAHARHVLHVANKLSRAFDHFAEFIGDEGALSEIDGALSQRPEDVQYGVSNFEKFASHIAKTRYLLEPLGVDVAQWSMAVDRESNSHVEFLFPVPVQPVFIDMLKRELDVERLAGRSFGLTQCNDLSTKGPQSTTRSCFDALEHHPQLCEALAAKSQQALQDIPVPDVAMDEAAEPTDQLEARAKAMASQMSLEQLSGAASAVYYTRCAGCHVDNYEQGPTYYPFDNPPVLGQLLARDRTSPMRKYEGQQFGQATSQGRRWSFDYISVGDRIWDRITRHARRHGTMPPAQNLFGSLSSDDRVLLRAHMLKVWENAGP